MLRVVVRLWRATTKKATKCRYLAYSMAGVYCECAGEDYAKSRTEYMGSEFGGHDIHETTPPLAQKRTINLAWCISASWDCRNVQFCISNRSADHLYVFWLSHLSPRIDWLHGGLRRNSNLLCMYPTNRTSLRAWQAVIGSWNVCNFQQWLLLLPGSACKQQQHRLQDLSAYRNWGISEVER